MPFAEYIPFRSFFRAFSDKVDLVTADFAAGHRPGAFRVPTPAGAPYWAIPTICFEVAYDDLMRDGDAPPGDGANMLVVQTNNATFGYTDESEQQFAISRLRAIEHGRSVVARLHGRGERLHPPRRHRTTDKTALFTAAAADGEPVVRATGAPSPTASAPRRSTSPLALRLLLAGLRTRAARGR